VTKRSTSTTEWVTVKDNPEFQTIGVPFFRTKSETRPKRGFYKLRKREICRQGVTVYLISKSVRSQMEQVSIHLSKEENTST
jgi:hypothetical protein